MVPVDLAWLLIKSCSPCVLDERLIQHWPHACGSLIWSKQSFMHLLQSFSVLLLLFTMVSCGAQSCSWEKATDSRGLSRHRASCHFYKRSSILAMQKRQQRARDATLATLVSTQSVNLNTSQVSNFPALNGHLAILETWTDSGVLSLPWDIL